MFVPVLIQKIKKLEIMGRQLKAALGFYIGWIGEPKNLAEMSRLSWLRLPVCCNVI